MFLITILFSLFLYSCNSRDEEKALPVYDMYKVLEKEYTPYIPKFTPPVPGTYDLPVIKCIKNHAILDIYGRERDLLSVKDSKIAVVSFIYTNCYDVYGCSMATYYTKLLDKEISESEELKDKVIFMSVSFDYERDTPKVMRKYMDLIKPSSNWYFFTTGGGKALDDLLMDFGQRIQKIYDERGNWLGFRHTLKVYLLDEKNCIRNIYSTGMLYHKLIISDIKTLTMKK